MPRKTSDPRTTTGRRSWNPRVRFSAPPGVRYGRLERDGLGVFVAIATDEKPSRPPAPDEGGRAGKAPNGVLLRFRHPKSAPIRSVTVNGKPWTEFNKDKETIALKGLTGTVAVTAQY